MLKILWSAAAVREAAWRDAGSHASTLYALPRAL